MAQYGNNHFCSQSVMYQAQLFVIMTFMAQHKSDGIKVVVVVVQNSLIFDSFAIHTRHITGCHHNQDTDIAGTSLAHQMPLLSSPPPLNDLTP